MNITQEGLPWEINDEGDKVCIGAEGDDWLLLTRRDLEQMLDAVRKELAEERAESWALWEFVHRYDEWAESDEQCGGPRFDAMLEMRGNLAQPKPHSHEEESE